MLDAILPSILTNASLAAAIVPFLQWLRQRGTLPVRLARIWSAAIAAVAAAGITYTFNADTGDLTFNVYAILTSTPLFLVEFAKQFGLQEALYRILQKLFTPPTTLRR